MVLGGGRGEVRCIGDGGGEGLWGRGGEGGRWLVGLFLRGRRIRGMMGRGGHHLRRRLLDREGVVGLGLVVGEEGEEEEEVEGVEGVVVLRGRRRWVAVSSKSRG